MSKQHGAKCRYLLDASALYPMLVRGIPFNPEECAISTLTEFEIGNTLWIQNKRKELDDPGRIAEIFQEIITELNKVWVDSIGKVLSIAVERNLTFYDASYAYLAEKKDMKLVTEDADLIKKCKCAIRIEEMEK
jgi:predicted nucleic acid-binding protein